MSRSEFTQHKSHAGSGTGCSIFGLQPSDTAVFIGYTEKPACADGEIHAPRPHRIDSMLAYEQTFGGPHLAPIGIDARLQADGRYHLSVQYDLQPLYQLYHAIKLFFHNGGRHCHVISVGTYRHSPTIDLRGDATLSPHSGYGLLDGVEVSSLIPGLAMLLAPDAIRLPPAAYEVLARAMLEQADRLGRRFVMFDLPCGKPPANDDRISSALSTYGHHWLENAAAYFPLLYAPLIPVARYAAAAHGVRVSIDEAAPVSLRSLRGPQQPLYNQIIDCLSGLRLLLPPSPAVAGLLAASERTHGVWLPGSHLPLQSVEDVAVYVDDALQRRLAGRIGTHSINALRRFPELGMRMPPGVTLACEDETWRFVSTRRLYQAIAESIRTGTQWIADAPNDASTWMQVRDSVTQFLDALWQTGALRGRTADEAYRVHCGLGATIHPRDLQERRLHIEVELALLAPNRYVPLRITQTTAC